MAMKKFLKMRKNLLTNNPTHGIIKIKKGEKNYDGNGNGNVL